MRPLDAIQAHLVSAGIGRVVGTAGAAPPVWLDPRDGVPAPGQGPDPAPVVIAIYTRGGFGTAPYRGSYEEPTFDLVIRSSKAVDAYDWWRSFVDVFDDKQSIDLGDLHVERTLITRQITLEDSSKEAGYFYTAGLYLQIRRAYLD